MPTAAPFQFISRSRRLPLRRVGASGAGAGAEPVCLPAMRLCSGELAGEVACLAGCFFYGVFPCPDGRRGCPSGRRLANRRGGSPEPGPIGRRRSCLARSGMRASWPLSSFPARLPLHHRSPVPRPPNSPGGRGARLRRASASPAGDAGLTTSRLPRRSLLRAAPQARPPPGPPGSRGRRRHQPLRRGRGPEDASGGRGGKGARWSRERRAGSNENERCVTLS